jgi:hypothetical protein
MFISSTPLYCRLTFSVFTVDEEAPPMPSIGWDDMNPDVDRNRLILLDNNGQSRRRVLTRMDNRSPFPPGQGFVVGSHTGGEFLGGKRRAPQPSYPVSKTLLTRSRLP